MYQALTDRLRKAMQLANQAAQVFNHEYIGTEHLLLGILREGGGLGCVVLKNLGADLDCLAVETKKLMTRGPSDVLTMGKLPQTPQAKKAIEFAMEEARALGHNYVGTEHLLLRLIRAGEGIASQVLAASGIKLESARDEIKAIVLSAGGVDKAASPRVLAFYRCKWCEKVVSLSAFFKGTPDSIPSTVQFAMAVFRMDKWYAANYTMHDCESGRQGVCDLLGFREAREQDEKP